MVKPVAQFVDGLTGSFGTMANQAGNRYGPVTIPGVNELLDAYRKNWISRERCDFYLRLHGVILDLSIQPASLIGEANAKGLERTWNLIYLAGQTVPSDQLITDMYLRGVISPNIRDHLLEHNGWKDADYKKYIDIASNEIPSSAQLIGHVTQQLFSPQFVSNWGLDDEYPAQIEQWQRVNGIMYDTGLQGYSLDPPGPVTFARMDWWSHWQLPNIAQLEDMRHRLRATLVDPSKARDPSGLIFNDALLDQLYEANAIPPGFRTAVKAINYRPIGIRVIQGLSNSRTVPKTEITEILLDQGYTPYSANIMTEYYWNKDAQARIVKERNAIFAEVIKAYELGLYSENDAAVLLEASLQHNAAEAAAYAALAPGDQLAQANSDPIVSGALRASDLKIAHDHTTKLIAQIKHKFEKLSYSSADSRKALVGIGMTLAAANRTIDEWTSGITVHHKELETSEILKLYREGIINAAVVSLRLQNLGWTVPDIQLLLVEQQREVAIAQAKAAAALAKTQQEQQAAQAKLAAAHQRAAAAAAAKASKNADTGQLERWYERGIISANQFNTRMASLGWSPLDISNSRNYIDSVVAAKPKKQAKQPKPPKQPASPKQRRSSASAILSWWGKGIITGADVDTKLAALNYSSSDISDMKQLEQSKKGFAGLP